MKSMRSVFGTFVLLAALTVAGCSCGDGGVVAMDDAGTDAPSPRDTGPRPDGRPGACPNLMVEPPEECDDGNAEAGDGCAPDCTLECGNGTVEGDELCDVAISPGDEGACPADDAACDDGDSCTTDARDGADCAASCSHAPITMAASGDGCCPPGADATFDDDCTAVCGNGVIESGESCETTIAAGMPGACPTSCDDMDACTTELLANAGTCQAACAATPITVPTNGDGCCPAGATIGTDDDCAVLCGDGVASMGETCDTMIPAGMPGACPTACNDGNVCTTDSLMGAGTCGATCVAMAITMPIGGDMCCPPGATIATDSDCTATCGDSVVSPGETCDTGIMTGAGRCPTSCNDGMACTRDMLVGAGTCAAACTFMGITMPANGDMCCPAGATIATDSDCPARCGDGVVSAGETCDTAIAGSCPAMCNDSMACTRDMLTGSMCTAACTFTPITMPANGDMCCPPGATIGTDSDCAARCGDRVITAPETCDDGNTTPGDGCDAMCRSEATPTAFRISDLDVRDPHFFANALGCIDITNLSLGSIQGVNPLLQTNIRTDEDADGQLDLSIVQVFTPLVQTGGTSTPTYVAFPDCVPPYTGSTCTLAAGAPRTMGTATSTAFMAGAPDEVCLGTIPGTTRASYTPALVLPTAPTGGSCYVADAGVVTIDLEGILIRLEDASIGGEWFGSPATEIRDGLIRGFITEAIANTTIIPEGTTGIDAIDGSPLSALLRGGMGNCDTPRTMRGDRDTRASDGAEGWYFYMNFTALRTTYTAL